MERMSDISDRLLNELVDAVKDIVRKEQSDRLRDIYLIGDIEKDSARLVIERLRELANDSRKPITIYMNTAGGNVTDGLAIHDTVRHLVTQGMQITVIVQGMAYSMGSVVLQAASPGRRLAFPHSWIMIHEPAKWAGWQSTTAAAQHLDRLKQMQSQIYRILAERSGRPLRQIIKDTKRTDFYLDAARAKEYGLIDGILGPVEPVAAPDDRAALAEAAASTDRPSPLGASTQNAPAEPVNVNVSAPSGENFPGS
jgi:ATP-dependent Clp protease, protease subunit